MIDENLYTDKEFWNGVKRPKLLLLGMVFSDKTEVNSGQEFRDRARCVALESVGYDVYTADHKHDTDTYNENCIAQGCKIHEGVPHSTRRMLARKDPCRHLEKHCRASYLKHRTFVTDIQTRWPGIKFDGIALDYFYSPIGWARENWKDALFVETLPALLQSGLMNDYCDIWIPHLDCTFNAIDHNITKIERHFRVSYETKLYCNPLYRGGELCEKELQQCTSNCTNDSQVRHLLDSASPWICLTAKPLK